MVAPVIFSRADHPISRTLIDDDALKVLHRLRKFNHTAYLVGGGVRDLLLQRHPKDFDIGTSAHPHEIKRIFRNCWIIGRRFRLAHVKFGSKTIEVATFRKQVPLDDKASVSSGGTKEPGKQASDDTNAPRQVIRRDNTFGTPEEDAFRRDFTINGLFYDISTFAIIDYVGGVEDLQNKILRCIGEPNERFVEDPVRMLRAVAFAARLDFRIDAPIRDAIKNNHAEIKNASPARLIEELYKLLRSGVSTKTFKGLSKSGLLQHIAPEVEHKKSIRLWRSLDALDAYRSRFTASPESLTNAVLLGSLMTPVQTLNLTPRRRDDRSVGLTLGDLPLARKDVDRLRRALVLQPRLTDPKLPARAVRGILTRPSFPDALTWLTIHGNYPDAVSRWQELAAKGPRPRPEKKRRRRRRKPRTVSPKD
ncbi:MAG: polynucleotide adenylyltransferase PcnB [Acidobacteriota bacterium]|nr:polynucleotide adenylyltransferase PcnB [Acidobacteriota bacterium]